MDFPFLGQSFEWPEQVPFRLTHNMTEAMGATGIEGSFRKCCEVTLRVLRKEMDTLLSVLKPFVHDPLVEWSKKTAGPKFRNDQLAEIKNEQVYRYWIGVYINQLMTVAYIII
jgi:serine/threonine-protein kinase ATR